MSSSLGASSEAQRSEPSTTSGALLGLSSDRCGGSVASNSRVIQTRGSGQKLLFLPSQMDVSIKESSLVDWPTRKWPLCILASSSKSLLT